MVDKVVVRNEDESTRRDVAPGDSGSNAFMTVLLILLLIAFLWWLLWGFGDRTADTTSTEPTTGTGTDVQLNVTPQQSNQQPAPETEQPTTEQPATPTQ